ncbi:GIP [Symbiodinium sp. CCMP2592]|nr:GIP [Symbiodinium sp. CCMP2592]
MWENDSDDSLLPSDLLTAPVVTRAKTLSEFTKAELITEATARNLWFHPSWTVTEIRSLIQEDGKCPSGNHLADAGMSKMTLEQLKHGEGGTILRILRDQEGMGAKTILNFGHFRGKMFQETPESYRTEVASHDNPSEDLPKQELKTVTFGGQEGLYEDYDEVYFECYEEKVESCEECARSKLKNKAFDYHDLVFYLSGSCGGWQAFHYFIAGMYTHGPFVGVTKTARELPWTIKYVNSFVRAQGVGEWTSFAIFRNTATECHTDTHNMAGTQIKTVSFGEITGGELWIR